MQRGWDDGRVQRTAHRWGAPLITITIDGQPFDAEEGQTVIDITRANAIALPMLCYHPALKPSGACRLCAVEVEGRSGRLTTMLACVLRVRDGLAVRTDGPLVERARRQAFERLLALAPQSESVRKLAAQWKVTLGPPPDGCIRCRLCIRVCQEIVGPGALVMHKHDGVHLVEPIEGRCIGCGTCVNICPTDAIRIEDKDNVRTIAIRDDVIGRHPLERCEGCGALFATPRFLEHIQARITPHPDLKEHHRYCSTCSKLFSDRVRVAGRRK